jgi:hypothetical protein
MTAALAQTRSMTIRHLRELWRQPWYVAITLVQPVIWLLLFGALFKRVVEIPGFGGGDYVDFLTPGIVVMTALFTAGWSGMSVIEDLNRGVMDRFLVSPVSRGSLIAGRLGQLAITIAIQSLVVVGLALAVGARFPGGIPGVALLVACSVLLACRRRALDRACARRSPRGDADRCRAARRPARHLPLRGAHQAGAGARLGAVDRALQPRELGRRRRPRGARLKRGLGSRRHTSRPARPARSRLRLGRDPGVPRLPAFRLTLDEKENSNDYRSNHLARSGGGRHVDRRPRPRSQRPHLVDLPDRSDSD